jgi:hypothetical protein
MQGVSCNLERVIQAQTMQINAFRISPQGQGQYKRSIQEHNMKKCEVNGGGVVRSIVVVWCGQCQATYDGANYKLEGTTSLLPAAT